jgi:hypothetical protein
MMGSGGMGWVVVAFISPLGLDVRRMAAKILSDTGRSQAPLSTPAPSKPKSRQGSKSRK